MKSFGKLLEGAFYAMIKEGLDMHGATITLKDGTRFKYKIELLKPRKTKRVKA